MSCRDIEHGAVHNNNNNNDIIIMCVNKEKEKKKQVFIHGDDYLLC